MRLPLKVNPGDPVRASEWNVMVDFLRSLLPNPSSGVRVTRGPSGTTFTADSGRGRTPTIVLPIPLFRIIDKSDKDGLKIGIYGGTVLDVQTGGRAYLAEDIGLITAKFTTQEVSGDGVVWLGISYDEDTHHASNSVWFATGSTVPNNDSGELYVVLGSWGVSSDGKSLNVASNDVGGLTFYSWRNWYSYPVTYSAACI